MPEPDIKLWLIGYWVDSWNDPRHLAPQEFVGRYTADTKRRLVEYLGSGQHLKHVAKFCGCSWCRFPECDNRQNGASEYGDRFWIWPSGLAHYVARHDVLLPAVFVDHVVSGSDAPPHIEHRPERIIPLKYFRKRKRFTSYVGVDTIWWTDWCRSNASGTVSGLMERLNPRVQREAETATRAHDVYRRYLDLVLRRASHELESGRLRRGEVDKI